MSKWSLAFLFIAVTGCGSTGTESSGTGDDDTTTGGPFCNQFTVGPGLICDATTTPPTLRVDFGNTAGKVVEGNDPRLAAINPNKGKFLGVFTPTANPVSNPRTLANPGGLLGGRGGGIILNSETQNVGVRAANEICAGITNFPGKTAAVPTAHACSQEELIWNTHAGNIPKNTQGMAFISTAYASYSTVGDPSVNNLKASCGNWTYDSGDLYNGTIWQVVEQNDKDLFILDRAITIRFVSGVDANVGCSAIRPIACCE